jgi:hypothetical protein
MRPKAENASSFTESKNSRVKQAATSPRVNQTLTSNNTIPTSQQGDDVTGTRFKPVSIVVQLSGELGNHLHKIAFGRAIQNLAKELYNIETQLVLQHQFRGGKWVSAMHDIKECFPNLRHFDFELGNSPEFFSRETQQQQWLRQQHQKLVFPNEVSESSINEGLAHLNNLLRTSDESSKPEIEPHDHFSYS